MATRLMLSLKKVPVRPEGVHPFEVMSVGGTELRDKFSSRAPGVNHQSPGALGPSTLDEGGFELLSMSSDRARL